MVLDNNKKDLKKPESMTKQPISKRPQDVSSKELPKQNKGQGVSHAERIERAKKVISESFLRELLFTEDSDGNVVENSSVTDISFNGTDMYIQDNNIGRYKIDSEKDPRIRAGKKPLMVTQEMVENLGNQVQNTMGDVWNTTSPILDSELGELRTNFMHKAVSPFGVTFALRVSRPRLAITDISTLCDKDTAKLLEVFMRCDFNLLISGQTGSGKTELQKALIGYIPQEKKISLMEDTLDSHIKEIYPQKDINSWATAGERGAENYIGFPDLIRAGLRNNPDWLMISEVRGAEAQDLLSAALTGHSIMTTLHATGADNIPSRLSNMVSMNEQASDYEALQLDIVSVLNLGLHMERVDDPKTGKISRIIREIYEYTEYRQGIGIIGVPIYEVKQNYNPETQEYELKKVKNRLSDGLLEKIKNKREIHNVPDDYSKGNRY